MSGPVPAAEEFRRAPVREGRLFVWRDRFDDDSWAEDDGVDVFGPRGSPFDLRKALALSGENVARLAFVDIETCGLADLPIFLVGALVFDGAGCEIIQYMAPDPSAEPEMLRSTATLLGEYDHWLSFNGRSFDIPRLRRRCALHGIDWPESPLHRDLLHLVRRRWKSTLPDCKLATVESRILGLERNSLDVPGREVPDRYYDFVRTGKTYLLDPVIEHNRRDVATLAVLLARIFSEEPESTPNSA